MKKTTQKVKSFFSYIFSSLKLLKNWNEFTIDLLRYFVNKPNLTNQYIFRDGTVISVHPNSRGLNFVFNAIFIRQDYDYLPQFTIQPTDFIIDIGAHLGFFSIKAAKLAYSGKVLAFEPFSKHYKLLKQNIERNKFSNIISFNEAVSSKTDEVNFYYTMDGDPGDTSLYILNPDKKLYSEKVREIPFNEIFDREKIDHCDFLKMDCEGAEYDILMYLSDENLNKIQKIAMEWHRFSPEHNPNNLISFLQKKGFKVIVPSDLNKKSGLLYAYRTV